MQIICDPTLEQVNITDPSKPPPKLLFGSIKVCPSRKIPKNGFKVFLLPIAFVQGQLKKVPIYFNIFTIKVVGQTIQACSTSKMSKLQSNGIIKLEMVKSLGLYCNLILQKSQKSKLKLVTGFQINFLCIFLYKVNHLKDLRPEGRYSKNLGISPTLPNILMPLKKQKCCV